MKARPGLVLLCLAGLAVGGHRQRLEPRPEEDSPLCRHRWIQGRLSACSSYRPWRDAFPPPATWAAFAADGLRRPAHQARPGGAGDPGAAVEVHRRALTELPAAVSVERLEGVADLLETAVALDPNRPEAWSDLAAVKLELGRGGAAPLRLVQGLEAALRAVALPDAPPAAHFNRALLLESLYLRDAAQAAWSDYLRFDSGSGWAADARARLAALEPSTPASPRHWLLAAPGRVSDHLLEGLASASEGSTEGEIERLRIVADEAAPGTDDTMLIDAVRSFERAWVAGGRTAVDGLLVAHRRLDRGYLAYQRGDLVEAAADLAAAQGALAALGSPYAGWAVFYRACVEQQRDSYQESAAMLDGLALALEERRHWSLRGFVEWMRGQNRGLLGRPLESIPHYRASLAHFVRAGLPSEQAAMHAHLAEALLEMGREEEAWQEIYQGLRLGPRIDHPRRAVNLYTVAADATSQAGQTAATAAFQAEALEAAAATGNARVHLLTWTAQVFQLRAAGDRETALAALAEARSLLDGVPDSASRARTAADVSLLAAALDPAVSRTSLAGLEDAIATYRRLGFRTPIAVAAYEERARHHVETGDLHAAAADLETALAIYEGRVDHEISKVLRWTLDRGARESYDRLISLYLGLDQPAAAFAVAERSRRFSLHSFDFAAGGGSPTGGGLDVAGLLGRITEDEAIVLFKLLRDEVATWVLDRGGLHLYRTPVDRERLVEAAAGFSKIARPRGSGDRRGELASYISARLLTPVLAATEGRRTLVFVPDGPLGNLPFAALPMPGGGFLVDRYTVVTAPSVELHLAANDRQRGGSGRGRALVVGDPAFERAHWPRLPPLSAAGEEGERVAAVYPRPVHLRGAEATRSAFLKAAPGAPVIHFAGHALVNEQRPDRSVLVLAPEPGEPTGALYQEEIYGLELPLGPVVVLSACSSGTVAGSSSEGFSSLSRAFLSQGATVVVASLWPVDDRVSSVLMQSLHGAIGAGAHPADALRRAQLEYLQDWELMNLDPFGWAAFQAAGASPMNR